MNISTEEMKAARISPRMRTWCAHHIPALQTCRYNNYWLPWKCEHEREMYEKCRFKEYELLGKSFGGLTSAQLLVASSLEGLDPFRPGSDEAA
jgi:NADH dehydrogenase (ubiquinone) 1 beta subcomplex subunit 7